MAETFEQVRGLTEHDLRELLEHGRPEQRVWAIWALALRSTDAVGELARRDEPDAGVRRTLAVVLAGHGELDLLVALARRDPAAEVRGAAMQLVARLALDGTLPTAIVLERAAADGPEVRIAILGVVFAGAPAWLTQLAIGMLEDREPEVRYEAFEALIRAGDPAHALAWLEELPEGEARIALMRWTARTPGGNERPAERVRSCATVLAHASRRLRRLMIECVRVATWYDVAPVIGEDPSLLTTFMRRGHNAIDEVPTSILMAAQLREHHDTWLHVLRNRIANLQAPDPDLGPLLPDYLERCQKRLGELDIQLAELRKTADVSEADLEAFEAHRDLLAQTCEGAIRLLVH
ncbi:MAG TPA: hypothetical protein VFQ65_33425 [Kofleriaceae bacterium]|nr:hypothetical protein [Kofleriaceae bacterium]